MWHHRFGDHEEGEGQPPFGHHGMGGRGVLPVAVLSLIKDKPVHGGEIIQTLTEKFGIEAPRPAIYMLLRRLEREGLLVSAWDIEASGPAKRKYTITEEGLEFFNAGLERLKRMGEIIRRLTGEKA